MALCKVTRRSGSLYLLLPKEIHQVHEIQEGDYVDINLNAIAPQGRALELRTVEKIPDQGLGLPKVVRASTAGSNTASLRVREDPEAFGKKGKMIMVAPILVGFALSLLALGLKAPGGIVSPVEVDSRAWPVRDATRAGGAW